MPAPQPSPPRLWGQTALEREMSRGVDRFRLTWNAVSGATSYGLRVDGGPERLEAPDVTVSGFDPNTLHSFEVRVHDVTGSSPWSAPFETVTRPPTPDPATQDPGAATLWGVALQWNVNAGFVGGAQSHVDVWRQFDGMDAVIATAQQVAGRLLDETDPEMRNKAYRIGLVVPAASVPGNPLPGDNASFRSAPLLVRGPVSRRVVMPYVQPQAARQVWLHHYAGGRGR